MMSFNSRLAEFWDWFDKNEARLSNYLSGLGKYESEEVVSAFSEGLNIAIDGCTFEVGGSNNEIVLTTDGNVAKMMLTTHLVNSTPEKYRGKWKFVPWKQPAPGATLSIYGKVMSADEIMLSAEYEDGGFGVELYHPVFKEMDEDEAFHLAYMMIDLSVGENLSVAFINWVDMTEESSDDMIPLSGLKDFMFTTAQNEEIELTDDYDPTERFFGYGFEPKNDKLPRYDVIAGFTNLRQLLDDYYNAESVSFDMLTNSGAKAVFLMFDRVNEDHQIDLDVRNNITDRLEAEVLGTARSGQEIGRVIGQAIGENHCYIDLVLYDESAFMNNVSSVIKDYDLDLYMLDYVAGAEARLLN